MTAEQLTALIRAIPDFPKPGIMFRDVSTLIGHGEGFAAAVTMLADRVRPEAPALIAGIEARGFIFGAAVAAQLGIGFVPVRKPGKLPVPTISAEYALEYGVDRLELDPGAIGEGERVVLIDDLIATGGTALAAIDLVRRAGGEVATALFVIDLPDLGGLARIGEAGVSGEALIAFAGH